jgi:hypothetical protein
MSSDAKEIQRLISEGDYWSALSLKPSAPPPEIILRVMELADEYPSLGAELNRVQIALTQKREAYENACGVRDKVCNAIVTEFGQVAFDLCPRATVWKRVWELDQDGARDNPSLLKKQIWNDIRQEIENIPPVELTTADVERGKAERLGVKSFRHPCRNCLGSGKLKWSIKQVVEEAQYDPDFRKHLELAKVPIVALARLCRENPEKAQERIEIPCPSCLIEISFDIPYDVEQGWVIKGLQGGVRGLGEQPVFGRVTEIKDVIDYEVACQRICVLLAQRYGPAASVLLPKESILEQLQMSANPDQAMDEVLTAAEEMISHLPSIRVTYHDYRGGKIRCQMVKQNCSKCQGKREVPCPICKGYRIVDEELKEIFGRHFSSTVACNECNGTGKTRCQCVMDATISIPKPMRRGWVVHFSSKNKSGRPEKSYVRLDYSWGQWASEIMLANLARGLMLIHPLTYLGQGLMLTIGILAFIASSAPDRNTFLPLLNAGIQGIGQGFSAITSFIKSPSSFSSLPIDPLTIDGLVLMQGVILILLPLMMFLRKTIADASKGALYDPISALLLITGQYLTARWILGLLSFIACLAGFSGVCLAIAGASIGLGLIGAYSLTGGTMILVAVVNSFRQDQD